MTAISFLLPELRRVEQCPATAIGTFLFEERAPLQGLLSLIDWRLHGHLSRLVIDGFLTGGAGEMLLVPLGRKLANKDLLVCGLGGPPRPLTYGEFRTALELLWASAAGLRHTELIVSLPGRTEELVDTVKAMEWLLEAYEPRKAQLRLSLFEPSLAHKAMQPIIERWRLRQLVP